MPHCNSLAIWLSDLLSCSSSGMRRRLQLAADKQNLLSCYGMVCAARIALEFKFMTVEKTFLI
jgi:hypothetical protein